MGGERLGEPVASDLFCGTVVVRRHHRIGPSIVGESGRRVGGEILDANRVVVDDAAGEQDEAGRDERAHLVGLLDQLVASLPSFSTLTQAFRDLISFCRALGGCRSRAAALEDAACRPLTIRNE